MKLDLAIYLAYDEDNFIPRSPCRSSSRGTPDRIRGPRRPLGLGEYKGIKIISLKQFLEGL